MKRFLCFLIPFGIVFGIAVAIHYILASAVAGLGFAAAYCYGD